MMKMTVFTSDNKSANVDKILYRLLRTKQNELKMMEMCGYNLDTAEFMMPGQKPNTPGEPVDFVDVDDIDDKFIETLHKIKKASFTLEDFKAFINTYRVFTTRTGFSTLYRSKADPEDTIFVVYLPNLPGRDTRKDDFIIFDNIVLTQLYKKILIVTQQSLTSSNQKCIDDQIKSIRVIQFTDSQFSVDVTKHAFAPLKTMTIKDDASGITTEMNQDPERKMYPRLKVTDPQSRWFGINSQSQFVAAEHASLHDPHSTSISVRYAW